MDKFIEQRDSSGHEGTDNRMCVYKIGHVAQASDMQDREIWKKRKRLGNPIHLCGAIITYNSDKFNLITDDLADD
jgi:hypothetical protein